MTKRGAIIDMGTNTWNLVIGEQTADGEAYIQRSKAVVKLAKGGIDTNRIVDEAKSRALDAVEKHLQTLSEFDVPISNLKAIGTSGMRSLENGKQLAEEIESRYGFTVSIIDGVEEANLIRKGVTKAIDLPDESFFLIMDIGGGSTEFIIGKGSRTVWKQSTDLGVSRLLEQFNADDTFTPVVLNQLGFFIDAKLKELTEQLSLYPVNVLIGSSGSFETLYSIQTNASQEKIENARLAHYMLNLEHQQVILEQLISSSLTDRLQWPGLIEMRAETMHIAALLVKKVMEYSNPNTLLVSEYALKEGALSAWLNQIQ